MNSYQEQTTSPAIQSGIETTYLGAISAASDLQTRLQTGKGNLTGLFTEFYRRFAELHMLTAVYLQGQDELINEVEAFLLPSPVDQDRAIKGIQIFRQYQRALTKDRIVVNKGMG